MAYPDTSNLGFGRGTNAASIAGTTGGVAGANKLWLPVWSGEVLAAYDHFRVFEPLVTHKQLSSGRVMEFPITGKVDLKAAWGAGEELEGNTTDYGSDTIGVKLDDRPFAAHFETDNIDAMISQWEYRGELARQAGLALANARDKHILAALVRAGASKSDIITGNKVAGETTGNIAGSVSANASFEDLGNTAKTAAERTDAALLLLQEIEAYHVYLQENHIMAENTFCAVTPQAFADIRALGVARDNSALLGGAGRPMFGGVADAGGLGNGLEDGYNALSDTLNYMGMTIIKSNHLRTLFAGNVRQPGSAAHTSQNGDTFGQANSGADFSVAAIGDIKYSLSYLDAKLKAVMWKPESVAALSLMGMKVDTVEDVRRNTNFTVASMMGGTGTLRPECVRLVTWNASATRNTDSTANALAKDLGMIDDFVSTVGTGAGYPFS